MCIGWKLGLSRYCESCCEVREASVFLLNSKKFVEAIFHTEYGLSLRVPHVELLVLLAKA
jgi:hypothetical protein